MKIVVKFTICLKVAEKEEKVVGVGRASLSSDRDNPD